MKLFDIAFRYLFMPGVGLWALVSLVKEARDAVVGGTDRRRVESRKVRTNGWRW